MNKIPGCFFGVFGGKWLKSGEFWMKWGNLAIKNVLICWCGASLNVLMELKIGIGQNYN